MGAMSPAYEALLRRLKASRRLLLQREIERAGLAAAVGLLCVALFVLVVALVAPLHRAEYSLLRIALASAGIVFLLAAVARVLGARVALADAALEAGSLEGERKDDLLAALELSSDTPGHGSWTSSGLRDAAIAAAADRASAIPIERLKRWARRGRWLTAAGCSLLLLAIAGVIGGAKTPAVLHHIADPASAPPAPVRIRVVPGNREIEGGETVAIRAYIAGSSRRPRLVALHGNDWKGSSFDDAETADGARGGEHAYQLILRNVNEDVVYRVRVDDQESPLYAIQVRDLPRATGYRIHYDYPGYTGLKPEDSQGITADLAAPRGTRAGIEVSLNRTVSKATLVFETSRQTVSGAPGDRSAAFQVPIRSDDRFTIRLEDVRGRKADLGPFDLRSIPDRPPTITVLAPGAVEDVAQDMTTEVLAGATDDHGVRKILLRYRVRQDPEKIDVLHEEHGSARELAVRYTWALGAYDLLPGEEIEFQVGAVDGDAVDGPQTTWSDSHRLRFPSAAEILSSVEQGRSETIDSLEDVLKGVRDLQQKSDDLSRDVGRSRELSWEQKQEVQKTLDTQEKLRNQLDKVAQQLSQDAQKLSESRAQNAELAQKIEELHQLLSEIKDQSLLRSMQRLQDAMKRMSPQEMERALQNFKMSQEDVKKSLERTIAMLKEIHNDEMMEEASERAAEMERKQIALNDSLSRAKQPSDVKDLSHSQKEIGSLSKEEQSALDSLANALSQSDPEASKKAQELSQSAGPQGMQSQMQKASDSMEAGDHQSSQQQGQQLSKQLGSFRTDVDKMREDYKQRKKDELAQKMESAAQDLLEISSLQQKMLSDESSDLKKRADTQKGLQESTESATNRIAEIAKHTLFVTPDVGLSLGRALANQQNAIGRYSNQDLAGGLGGSKESAIALNQAAAGLLRQKESMQGASSSTGMQEAMDRLQSLAGQQEGLNQQSMGMMPGGQQSGGTQGEGGDRPREGAGEALGRMAAEQEAIRRGLEETMGKLGENGGGTLGNLGGVADDMKKVEQDLRSGRLEQETVDRQHRILSRLLDAPRSVEKRDYSRRRQSRPGVDVVRASPETLSPDLLKSKPSLAALLARGSRDPITPRYRATVDEYFQSLLEGKDR
jgi:hypothetical protein